VVPRFAREAVGRYLGTVDLDLLRSIKESRRLLLPVLTENKLSRSTCTCVHLLGFFLHVVPVVLPDLHVHVGNLHVPVHGPKLVKS
jgi:hypothetical protein